MPSPLEAMETFRQELLAENLPHQLFSVCRLDGEEELRLDTFGHYKDKRKNFRVEPRMRFDNKVGVGSGPLREFHAMCIVWWGFGLIRCSGKVNNLFRGRECQSITSPWDFWSWGWKVCNALSSRVSFHLPNWLWTGKQVVCQVPEVPDSWSNLLEKSKWPVHVC